LFREKLIGILLILLIVSNTGKTQGIFVDLADSLGINHSYGEGTSGAGVSFIDFDNDGWDDLSLATQEGENLIFYKNKKGFFNQVEISGIEDTSEAKHLLWIDFDNDGDKDLFVSNLFGIDKLFRNNGNFTFSDITVESGFPDKARSTYGVAAADYDRDGWLDLYLTHRKQGQIEDNANKLYKNNRDGTFTEVAESARVSDIQKLPFCAAFFDYNNDGWEDIHIVQDFDIKSVLYENMGNGKFKDVSAASKVDLPIGGMGIAIGDYNNDGFFDIYNSNTTEGNKLLKNNGGQFFTEHAEEANVAFNGWGWAVSFFDYDNDADPDIYVSGALPDIPALNFSALYRNKGDGTFQHPDGIGFIGDSVVGYSHAIGDWNNDGFSDIAVNNHAPYSTHLWSNGTLGNNWVKVHLKGILSNRDAVGAVINFFIDGGRYMDFIVCGSGFLSQHSQYKILGLGASDRVDSIIVRWPSGYVDVLKNIEANQIIKIEEGSSKIIPKIKIEVGKRDCGGALELRAGLYGRGVTYRWSTGSEKRGIEVNHTGNYSLIINSPLGTFEDSIQVNLEPLSLELSTTPQTPENQYGSATVLVNGGLPPYTFQWDDPRSQTTQTADSLVAGKYNVKVTDQYGCSKSATVEVPIITSAEERSLPVMTIYPNPASEKLRIRFSQIQNGPIKISVIDLVGNKKLNKWVPATFSEGEIEVELINVPQGSYLLVIDLVKEPTQFFKMILR